MAGESTYLSDVYLITCVVESGLADKIVDAATNVGAQGATINYARGTGIRDRMGLLGVTIDEQKEIIRIIVFLHEQKAGHQLWIEDKVCVGTAGSYFGWTKGVEHMAANLGSEDRYILQVTGIK